MPEKDQMKIGGIYKFKSGDCPYLIYKGYNWSGNGYWHQFANKYNGKIWSELQTSDLWMIEEVPNA
jgi:hypothetical protein